MNHLLLATVALLPFSSNFTDQTAALIDEITQQGQAYDDLRDLTAMGPRLSGSAGAERAIAWAQAKMAAYHFDNIHLQPTPIPVWTRGDHESATLTDAAGTTNLRVAALGGSVGTTSAGIEAPVIEVQSLDEVSRLGTQVRGKIVFYNRPMDASLADPFEAYGGAVDQRSSGASVAGRYGAVAVLVRTLTTLADDDHPHTGILRYSSGVAKIPAAAISTHGANELSRRLRADPAARVRLRLSCANHPNATSYNVIGEITGSELPQQVVVVGGHLDSWDLGQGAHDDGTGVVQSLEVVRAMKALGLRPKRTIRVVLFMAEEQGGWGGATYADFARSNADTNGNGEQHIAAIESDRGGFAPVGFSTSAGSDALAKLKAFAPLLTPLHADNISYGESGTDIEPLDALGTVTIGYIPDATHYFDYHHSETDVFANVVASDLHAGAAAMATLAWAIAENGL